jgi:hypothetical protein
VKKNALRVSLAAAFLIVFVALAISNFVLRRQLAEARAALQNGAVRPETAFREGDVLDRFPVVDRDGKPVMVGGTSGGEWVLILIHPRCHQCDHLLDDMSAKNVTQVTLVSLAPRQLARAEIEKVAPSIPLYFVEHASRSPIAEHAHVVPQILRVGAEGRIRQVCPSLERCGVVPAACATCTAQ